MEINIEIGYNLWELIGFIVAAMMLNCLVNDVRSRKFDAEALTIRFRHIKFINFITVILEIENVLFTLSFDQIVCLLVGIVSLQCDAIVNSTRGDLHLNQGAVSATILAAAGDNIQNECDEIMNRRGRKLSSTEVEMTKGYNLRCKYVLHGALISPWNEQV